MRAYGPGFDTGSINPMIVPDGYKIWKQPEGNKVAEFHASMLLQEKAAHAIQRGDMVGGWIRFVLPISREQLNSGQTTLAVYCKDVYENEYSYESNHLPPQGPTYSPATAS